MYPLMLIDQYRQVDRTVKRNWEHYFSFGKMEEELRDVVVSSWERCKHTNLSQALTQAPKQLSDYQLKLTKDRNELLLKVARPIVHMLCEQFQTKGLIMVLTDTDGTILLEEATGDTIREFDRLNFSRGAVWSEEYCGTNAIGTALKNQAPVTIFSAEHYCEGWHHLVCSATVIRDPFTRTPLGILDLTGRKELLGAHNFSIVHAAKVFIEQALEQEFIHRIPSPYPHLLEEKKPVVIFNEEGKVTRYNRIAKLLFEVKEQLDFPYKFQLPTGSQLNKHMKVSLHYHADDGSDWNMVIYPHLFSDQLMGGIVLFDPIVGTQGSLAPEKKAKQEEMIVQSPALRRCLQDAQRASGFDFPVLLQGATGAGKEKFAQYIHNQSARNLASFVPVNCGAIPRDLIASELFGYVQGAFTGADSKGKKGKFEQAHRGTLFLDEIAELPLDIQPYLLRILEEKKVYPLGGDKAVPVDVRIIAATHRDLEKEVREGRFRSDLFYRLNVIQIQLPDLKDRTEDIIPLFCYFLDQHLAYPVHIQVEVQSKLIQYHWPGNVRELKNAAEYVVYMLNGALEITCLHLPPTIIQYEAPLTAKEEDQQVSLITSLLKQTNGNVSKAAKMLNISRMTIYRKLKSS